MNCQRQAFINKVESNYSAIHFKDLPNLVASTTSGDGNSMEWGLRISSTVFTTACRGSYVMKHLNSARPDEVHSDGKKSKSEWRSAFLFTFTF